MGVLVLLLLPAAFICFLVAAFVPAMQLRLVAFGLACVALALFLQDLGAVHINTR